MGKDLKGKNIGKGISQRKDGKYTARFTSKSGYRIEKHFISLNEAKNWLFEAQYEDKHSIAGKAPQMTVDEWFNFWITEYKEKTTRFNTVTAYRESYKNNIKDVIGKMIISDVLPMHCQKVLNLMEEKYKASTINHCRITMSNMFAYAVENHIIAASPVEKSVKNPKRDEKRKVRFLTLDEQKRFIEAAEGTSNYLQFVFVLQTGLRTGELVGLILTLIYNIDKIQKMWYNRKG